MVQRVKWKNLFEPQNSHKKKKSWHNSEDVRKNKLGSHWSVSLAYVLTSRPLRDLVSKDKVDSVVGRQYLKLASGLHMHTCTCVHHHRHEYRHMYIYTLCFEPTIESLRLHMSVYHWALR